MNSDNTSSHHNCPYSTSDQGEDKHSEAPKDEQVWDALCIVANEIDDKNLVVTARYVTQKAEDTL
jgi:hypothetical protein